MDHLVDFFDRHLRGHGAAIRTDDGVRRTSSSYDDVRRGAERFAARLAAQGVQPGDRLVLWGDNAPEWVMAFWGCVLRGVAVVPLDAHASAEFARRVAATAAPRGVLIGEHLEAPSLPPDVFVWRLDELAEAAAAPAGPGEARPRAAVTPETVAEILFTSGTTGEPKGVVITHRNLMANVEPLERAARQYRHYLWPFRPLRFLVLLPLSHMFGQAVALIVPPLVGATVVFVRGYGPADLIGRVRQHRITLVMTVPRVLDLLRRRLRRVAPSCAAPAPRPSLAGRIWQSREARRLLGWRCCGFVVGGAFLDPGLEEYWRRLGFAVVQGYGLTETAPIVAWNNPFAIGHGTVGVPLEGMDVRIAPDGEVLVRGAAVSPGYLNAPEDTRAAFDADWFHTGDIGSFDERGRLRVHGRKKDVIVTADGLNVFPEDVEPVLEQVPGVREAAVVGQGQAAAHVHAVLVLDPGVDAAAVIRQANVTLEAHQRIRGVSVWPEPQLPRTAATGKVRRAEVRRWVEGGAAARDGGGPAAGDIAGLVARFAPAHAVTSRVTLDELGLTSLDRIELAMAIEEQAGVAVDEEQIVAARTVADLGRLVEDARDGGGPGPRGEAFPRWTRTGPAVAWRAVHQALWIRPATRRLARLTVRGLEHLDGLHPPVIFAANHQSHLDTPVILASLPPAWRRRVAVAMAKDFFDPHFNPAGHGRRDRLTYGAAYFLAVLFFNAFPLPRAGPGARDALRYIGELAAAGQSILIFPEGHRTERGEIAAFQPGVAMMASRVRVPVVPVRLSGLDHILHHSWRWPRPGRAQVTFGAPLQLRGDDYRALAHLVEAAVGALDGGPRPPHMEARS